MGLFNYGEVEKLTIGTYKDSNYKNRIANGAFKAFINPENFSITYKTDFTTEQATGASAGDMKFNVTVPSSLTLNFLFDGTGVTEANSGNALINKLTGEKFTKKAVKEQLSDFYKATGEYDGKIHKPYNIIINWGDFEFKGVLSEFTIDYKLFANDGLPLRAIGKATFLESKSVELANKEANRTSPDLTHLITVKAGDTLPLMADRIYGDSKYYLEVAKANNLINFRQLTPGQELFFPPIEKVS